MCTYKAKIRSCLLVKYVWNQESVFVQLTTSHPHPRVATASLQAFFKQKRRLKKSVNNHISGLVRMFNPMMHRAGTSVKVSMVCRSVLPVIKCESFSLHRAAIFQFRTWFHSACVRHVVRSAIAASQRWSRISLSYVQSSGVWLGN